MLDSLLDDQDTLNNRTLAATVGTRKNRQWPKGEFRFLTYRFEVKHLPFSNHRLSPYV